MIFERRSNRPRSRVETRSKGRGRRYRPRPTVSLEREQIEDQGVDVGRGELRSLAVRLLDDLDLVLSELRVDLSLPIGDDDEGRQVARAEPVQLKRSVGLDGRCIEADEDLPLSVARETTARVGEGDRHLGREHDGLRT